MFNHWPWKCVRFICLYFFTLNFIIFSTPVYALSRYESKNQSQTFRVSNSETPKMATIETKNNFRKEQKRNYFFDQISRSKDLEQYKKNLESYKKNFLRNRKLLNCQSHFSLPSDKQCSGTFVAVSQAQLDQYYSSNYGLNNNKYKNLTINFTPSSGELLLKTPCKLTLAHDLQGSELCAIGRTGVESNNGKTHNFSGNVSIYSEAGDVQLGNNNVLHGNFLFVEGGQNTNIGNNSSVSGLNMLFFADHNDISIQNGVHFDGANALFEAQNSVLVSQNSVLNFQNNLSLVSDSPSKNVIVEQNAVINSGSLFLASFGGGGSVQIKQNAHINTSQAPLKVITNGAGSVLFNQNSIINVKGLDVSSGGSVVVEQNAQIVSSQGVIVKSSGSGNNFRIEMAQNSSLSAQQDIDMSAENLIQLKNNVNIVTLGNLNIDGSQCDISTHLSITANSDSGRCAPPRVQANKASGYINSAVLISTFHLTLSQNQYTATLGNQTVTLAKVTEDSVFLLVPQINPGTYSLSFDINGTSFSIPLTVSNSPVINDPDVIINQTRQFLFDGIQSLPGNATADRNAIQHYLDLFDQGLAQLSPADKESLAQFMNANPEFYGQGFKSYKASKMQRTFAERIHDDSVQAVLRALAVIVPLIVIYGASQYLGTNPGFGAGFVAAWAAIAAALIVFYHTVDFLITAIFNFGERVSNLVTSWFVSKGDLDFISGTAKLLTATAQFRPLDRRDVGSQEPKIQKIISSARKIFTLWNSVGLSNVLNISPVDIDNLDRSGDQNYTLDISPQFISIENVTNGVQVNAFPAGESTSVTFTSQNQTNFNFDLSYHPEGYRGDTLMLNNATVGSNIVFGCISLFPPNGVTGHVQENGGGFVADSAAVHPSVFIEPGSEVCESASIFTPDSSPITITGNSMIRGMTNFFAQNGGHISINNAKFGLQANDAPTSGTDGSLYPNGVVVEEATVYENGAITGNAHVIGTDTRIFGHAHIDGDAVISTGAKIRGDSLVFEHATVRDFAEVNINPPFAPNFPQISGSAEIANLGTLVEGETIVAQGAKVLNGAKIHGPHNSIRGTCIVDFGDWNGELRVPDEQTNSCAPFSQYKKIKVRKVDNSEEIAASIQRRAFYDNAANEFRDLMHSRKNRVAK